MNDLISRQAAIDVIDEWIKAFRENGHRESAADARFIQDGIIQLPSVQPFEDIHREKEQAYYCGYEDGAKVTRSELTSVQEQRWIPVTERLPEHYRDILVSDIDGDMEIARLEEIWDGDKEELKWWIQDYGTIEVNAWMPLPEPYKEGK